MSLGMKKSLFIWKSRAKLHFQNCTFKFSECALLVQIRSTTLDQMTLVLVGKSVQYENLKNPVPVIEFVTWSLTFSILS